MTQFKQPQFPAAFANSNPPLREFDKQLVMVLASMASNLKAILEQGISVEDNLDAALISFSSSGTPDAENTVAHALGKIPTGFVVYSLDKGAVVYKGTTAWTETNIYLKVNVASVAVMAWVF